MINANITLEDIKIEDININHTNFIKISKEIFDIKPIVEEKIKIQINPLQAIANKYILSMQKTLNQMQNLIELYEKKKKYLQQLKKYQTVAKEYARIKNQITQTDIEFLSKELIILSDNFTTEIQRALGKNVKIIYLYQNSTGEVVEAYEINKIEDLLKIEHNKDFIAVKLTATKKFLEENEKLLSKEQYGIGESQASLLNTTYQTVIHRYNKYRYNYKSLILWNMKSRPKWHGMWLSQRGDLSQAYVNFVVRRNMPSFLGNANNPPETDIQLFMQVVQGVDATFGGVQGDIEDEEQNLSVAVKSLKASPQGIFDTIQMAKDLLTGQINIENFQQYKKTWEKTGRNTIIKVTQKETQQLLKTLTK